MLDRALGGGSLEPGQAMTDSTMDDREEIADTLSHILSYKADLRTTNKQRIARAASW
jgi:hypothetical protein